MLSPSGVPMCVQYRYTMAVLTGKVVCSREQGVTPPIGGHEVGWLLPHPEERFIHDEL